MLLLAVERPGTHLLVWSICKRTCHEDSLCLVQRKDIVVVLKKDSRLYGSLFCCCKMLWSIVNLRRESLVSIWVLKETEFELELEDVADSTVDLLLRNLALLYESLGILDEAI